MVSATKDKEVDEKLSYQNWLLGGTEEVPFVDGCKQSRFVNRRTVKRSN